MLHRDPPRPHPSATGAAAAAASSSSSAAASSSGPAAGTSSSSTTTTTQPFAPTIPYEVLDRRYNAAVNLESWELLAMNSIASDESIPRVRLRLLKALAGLPVEDTVPVGGGRAGGGGGVGGSGSGSGRDGRRRG